MRREYQLQSCFTKKLYL